MVEELKLAIKVDDDAIEQSLLKQFSNAEKMANKVVLTFNNIDLDDKAIEAKFKEMQKMAGKNPIDLSIDKSSIEMLSAISKQLGNIFDIAKGKSIIDHSATAIKEESQALEQVSTSAKDAASSKEKFAKANKEVKASADETVISVDKEISALEKAGSRFESQAAGLAIKPDDQHQFSSWKKQLEDLNIEIAEYKSKVEDLSKIDIADETQINKAKTEIENLGKSIKETITTMSKTPQTKRGWTDIGTSKAAEKVANVLKQNTKMSKEAKDAIRAYYNELRSGNPSQPIDEILVKVNQLVQKERELGRVGKSFGEIFKEKVIYGGAAQLAGMVGFYDVINVGREAFETIKELDTALVDLKKTTAMNSSQLEEFYFDSNDVAKQMGVTTQAIIEQSSAWSRLGYNTKEASTQMAELSSQFASISPGMDTEQSQEGLVSIMKAWDVDVSDVKSEIMDNINTLGNNFAETNNDIVEGMKRSAAALAAVGTSYKDSFALFTGIQEILQNSEVVGRSLRSISLRIRGYSEDSEDGFLETDESLKNITGDLIDLTKTAEHTQGVSIFKEGSTTEFKSLVEYFGEISDIWDEMSEKQQNDYLQTAFGKTQANFMCLNVQKCA